MRWFVEVSSIGDGSAHEKFCVEGKQWQSALQEARRLRGDTGPLSKFSIEVLDEGYRAVNTTQKTRYLVRLAPPDEPLTEAPRTSSPAPAGEAAPSASSSSFVPVPADEIPSHAPSVPVPPTTLPAPPSEPAPDDSAPRAPLSPASTPPDAPLVPPPIESALILERTDAPTGENPILFYEAAYSVAPESSKEEVERVLLTRFQEVCSVLEGQSSKRYVTLAIFDHAFEKRPLRPPLATLAWKEWRGAPVLGFPAFGQPAPPLSIPPRPASPSSMPAPPTESVRVLRSVPVGDVSSSGGAGSVPKPAPVPEIEESDIVEEPPPAPPETDPQQG